MSASGDLEFSRSVREIRQPPIFRLSTESGFGALPEEEIGEHFAAIVASSDDAIVSKTLEGLITSWNRGAERLFGYAPEEIVGRSILTIIPPDRHEEEREIIAKLSRGERIEHYETIRCRKDGSLVDISLTVSPLRGKDGGVIGASKIARDITRRKQADAKLRRQTQRLETLNRAARIISRDLDLDRIVQSVTDIASDLAEARFGAFFYNVVEGEDEAYLLYALSGAPRAAFERFGMPRNTEIFRPTFEGTAIVRSDDIRKDPRYGQNAPHRGMPEGHLPVVSYLAVPVISSSGDVIGGLFFGHDEPGRFDAETETLISAVAAQAAVAIDNARLHKAARAEIERRRRVEEARELLLNEIKHRVKNTIATVQAMASQTFRNAPVEERQAFVARLHALASAHDLLTQQGWELVPVRSIVEQALEPFLERDRERISFMGPDARLSSAKALLLALALHELGTNAVKYGALANDDGRIDVRWEVADEVPNFPKFKLLWRESNGPPVAAPTRKGFGTRMIERALKGEQGEANFDFAAAGLSFEMEMAI